MNVSTNLSLETPTKLVPFDSNSWSPTCSLPIETENDPDFPTKYTIDKESQTLISIIQMYQIGNNSILKFA